METRYYSERGRPTREPKLALHASRKVFERITGHLDRKERIREEIEKETSHKQYLRDATRAMTSNWDNSVENLRKKKEEARVQRLAQKADDRVEQYYKVLECQAEERKKYNEEVSKTLFITRPPQKDLNSALLLSECLYANEVHTALKKKQEEHAKKDWEEFEQQIIEEDATFKRNEELKECKIKTNAKRHQNFIKQQIIEKQKLKEAEVLSKLESEKVDIAKQIEEMSSIQKNSEDDFLKSKRCALEILRNSREAKKKDQLANEERDSELATVCEIYKNFKTDLECKRIKMRKMEIQKTLEKQEIASKKLMEIYNQNQSREDELIAKAVAEQEEAEAIKKQKRKEYDDRLLEERKKNYENALKDQEKQKEKAREIQKWEMLNRIKLSEIVEEEKQEREQRRKDKMRKFAEIIDEQVEERKILRAEKKAKEDAFKWNNYPEVDEKFLKYGEEMLAQQKAAGKSTYPIEFAIMAYKKKHGLVQPKLNKPFACTEENQKNEKVKLPVITRRICPDKNNSTAVKGCFCT